MNVTVFKRILETLYSPDKAVFELECNSINYNYNIHIDKNIKVKATSRNNLKNSLEAIYIDVDDVELEEITPTKITETRYTNSGSLSSKTMVMIYNEAELLLFVFKVLRQNVCFVLQNSEVTRCCFFINTRAMYIKSTKQVNELVDTNIYRLYGSMKNAKVIMFSTLPSKYNCGDFYAEQNRIARKHNKEFRDTREGIGVR